MSRPLLLVDIGAGDLPNTTPPATVPASWVPVVYTAPDPPMPAGFAAVALADSVLLTWAPVDATLPIYVIEQAPDVAGAPGAWVETGRTTDLHYSMQIAAGAKTWWRLHAVSLGRSSATTAAIAATPLSTATLSQQLTDIASDSLLTPNEKPGVICDRDAIVAEQAGIDAKATAFGITTEKTAYDNAVSALTSYLATLTTPVLWSNLTGNTTIVGTTFRSKFLDVWSVRQTLLNAIYAAAKSLADTAQAAATAAQADATSSLSKIADIASDGVLSPNEKPEIIQKRDAIVAEQSGIDAKATQYAITTEKTAYDSAVSSLTAYLATLTSPVLWSNLTGNTNIVRTTFNQKFVDVYTARQALLNAIYAAAKALADAAQTSADDAQDTADAAQAAATAAQSDATNALNQLTNISSDNLLTPGEKPMVIKDRDAITAEQAGIDAQATTYGITTEKTAYDSAVSALTSYLATLTSPVLWSNLSGNTTIVGTTFRSKFLDVYSARQALLNVIYAVAKGNGSQGKNLIANPSFSQNALGNALNAFVSPGESVWDSWTATSINTDKGGVVVREVVDGASAFYIRLDRNATIPNDNTFYVIGAVTSDEVGVIAGRTYVLSASCKLTRNAAPPAGATWIVRFAVRWKDGSGSDITPAGNYADNNSTIGAFTLNKTLVAPPNAASAVVQGVLYWRNNSGSDWNTGSSIYSDARFFYASMVEVADLDSEVQDGTNYGRLSNLDLYSTGGFNRLGLRFGGSGHRIGDQRNLTQIMVGNGQAKVPTVVTYTAASGSPATATISVAAWTMLSGSVSVSYGAKSVGVTGANGTTVTYYLYLDDPTFAGTGTLVATTNGNNVYGADGRVYVGSADVTFPASGSGSGGGLGGGSGNTCVCLDMWLARDLQASDAEEGLALDCIDIPQRGLEKFRSPIGSVEFAEADCVEIETTFGAVLRCSAATPFDLPGGGSEFAADLLGCDVATDLGVEQVMRVTRIGLQAVAYIHAGGVSFAAGAKPGHRIYSHNGIKP